MKYAIDAEFIDTPTCSELISFAIVREDGKFRYFEFAYPEDELTDWLRQNVVPKLTGDRTSFTNAKHTLRNFLNDGIAQDYQPPQIYAYYASYDWYWFCRIMGGFMEFPKIWPARPIELADKISALPISPLLEHNALNDARATMDALLRLNHT